MSDWIYSNHSLMPNTPFKDNPVLSDLRSKSFWKRKEGKVLFARWISNFDCPTPTPFWNTVKDSPFNIGDVKKKRRYEIKKGAKHFRVSRISFSEHKEDLFNVYSLSSAGFPEHLKKDFCYKNFVDQFDLDGEVFIFAAFSEENNRIEGYAILRKIGKYIGFNTLRSNPAEENKNVNFALVYSILLFFNDDIRNGCIIDDGARPIIHTSTKFQDFLEKYFLFRKAYSFLEIEYRRSVKIMIRFLRPLRFLFRKTNIKPFRLIISLILQDEIASECKRLKQSER